MRLKKLTMQAFGPFKDKVVIDFEDNNINKGLLLISGDTGSGKTTIFDAICYALYGQTSGEVRTSNSLRSDFASNDIDTYVDLEFYYKNKLYEIRRSPEYMRKKKSGDGETKQVPTAEINIDGEIYTKVNDVTKKIEELIGLDYKQFRQVAMLSQGEFTKFLLASSEEKTTIFRKIFGTEFYDILQNKLKSNMLVKKDEIEKVKYKIDNEIKNIESIIDVSGLNNEEMLLKLNDKIKELNDIVLLTKTSRDKTNEERTKLNTEITTLDKLNKDILNYKSAKEKLDNLLVNNVNINQDKEKYNYNIKVANTISNILDNIKKDNDLLKDKQNKEKENNELLKQVKNEYNSNKEKYDNLDNYLKDIDSLNEEINILLNKNKDYDNYLNKIKELNDKELRYKDVSKDYLLSNELYENMRKEYYLNISVEIAETLVDGEECPVCGSIHHPKKAISIDSKYTKEDIDKQEKILKDKDSIRKSIEASIEEIRNGLKEYKIDSDKDILELKEDNTKLLEDKKKNKVSLNNEYNTLIKDKDRIIKSITMYEGNIKIFNEDIKQLEDNIKEYNIKLDNIYKEFNTNYDDYLIKKIDRYELDKLRKKIELFDNTKSNLESTIKLLEDEVKDKKIVDLSSKQNELNELTTKYRELDNEYTSNNVILEKLKTSTSNIDKYFKDNKKIQNEYEIVKVLSDTVNGNLVGKQRITFENYVQSYFMNYVLVEANKRLLKMTDSRYELKKKEIEAKLNTKTGLDFAIFDSYTGKERDVSSLSGGEKFKASLALALGLSDVISNNRGGIRIDSLFVDEGFGSLDSESLNQALNILTDLSGNDKLVGIISHVSELISRIDNKIIVKKNNTGSSISIEA